MNFKKYLSIALILGISFFCKGVFFGFTHLNFSETTVSSEAMVHTAYTGADQVNCCGNASQENSSADDVSMHHKFLAILSSVSSISWVIVFALFILFCLVFSFIGIAKIRYQTGIPPPVFWLNILFSRGILHPKSW